MSRMIRLACLAAWLASAAMPPVSHAAAPQAGIAAPGFYRMMVGKFEITALSDGTLALPMDVLLAHTTPKAAQARLASRMQALPLPTSFNAYLVNTGSKLILVDSGAGTLFGAGLGQMLANLKASGYQPEQVDDICITHLHPDHVGGIAADGVRVFPNAVVHVDQRDLDYWLDDANAAKAPEASRSFFAGARASLQPYLDAGAVAPFSGPTVLADGFRAVATPGHTIGHSSYVVESAGARLVILGDLVHVQAIQFAHPAVTIRFDSDQGMARSTRLSAFKAGAASGDWLAGAHLDFPGIGHVRPLAGSPSPAYEWIPVRPIAAP